MSQGPPLSSRLISLTPPGIPPLLDHIWPCTHQLRIRTVTQAWGMDIKPSPQSKQPWLALKDPKQRGMRVFGGVQVGSCSTATECCGTQDLEKTPCRVGWGDEAVSAIKELLGRGGLRTHRSHYKAAFEPHSQSWPIGDQNCKVGYG